MSDFVMPPAGTSVGCRRDDGTMWVSCRQVDTGKPSIAVCEYAGNWVNPPLYSIVATFEKAADRDLVLELHRRLVTGV